MHLGVRLPSAFCIKYATVGIYYYKYDYSMLNNLTQKCSWFSSNVGLFVLRLGVGAVFIYAGYMKVADLDATVTMFGSMGIGAFLAYFVSFAELIGGIMVLLGICTRFAAFVLAVIMLVAVWMVRADMMMIMTPFMTLFASLSLMFGGAGCCALDNVWCKKSTGTPVAPQA